MPLPLSSLACPRSRASSGPVWVVKDFGGALGESGDPAPTGTGGCRAVSALRDVFPLNSHLEHVGQKESEFFGGMRNCNLL